MCYVILSVKRNVVLSVMGAIRVQEDGRTGGREGWMDDRMDELLCGLVCCAECCARLLSKGVVCWDTTLQGDHNSWVV